ncbi:Ground region domain containing protein [Aphelenchoides besseyi]|nr:Ground region domain containing protein [Aphelenchoides besseyi]
MGGGGGCGGGCAPMCGCGRKKRSVIEPQIRTEESAPCPQSAWKSIIEESVTNDVTNSKYAVQNALFKTYETKFLITCAKAEDKHHLQFVTNGEGYCTAGNDQIWCAAVVLQA